MKKLKKLHLGCGEIHLEGYLNIDFPPSSHPVQTLSGADYFQDITTLTFPKESIQEIRLHHVFEHFSRPVAAALISSWWSWLVVDGILHIEVPDFYKCALIIVNPFSAERAKMKALRHIFGSHEAPWAHHLEGWTKQIITRLLSLFGYTVLDVRRNSYKGIPNIDVFAKKRDLCLSKSDFLSLGLRFLRQYTVDDTPTEKKILRTWMKKYSETLDKCWGTGE